MIVTLRSAVLPVAALLPMSVAAVVQDAEELAKKLSNPISSLISRPLQANYDSNIGAADDGERFALNIQPVIPIDIGGGWNVISRTILPIVAQDAILRGAGDQFGIGDVTQSFFFRRRSRHRATSSGASDPSSSFPPRPTTFSAAASSGSAPPASFLPSADRGRWARSPTTSGR